MDTDKHYKELLELVNNLGITVTDTMKPTELFDSFIKLLAAYAAEQPTNDEIADYTMRKMQRDIESFSRSRGLR